MYTLKNKIKILLGSVLLFTSLFATSPATQNNALTDKQLYAVIGIITNFILSSNSSTTPSPSKQKLAIEKISKYADSSNNAPTIQDYIDAGVIGVTSANLNSINQAVKDTNSTSVDTSSEIQTLVNRIVNNLVKKYKVVLKSSQKIAGYEIHLKFTDDIPTESNTKIINNFLSITGRIVNNLGTDINSTTKEIKFGGFTFGNQEGITGEFDVMTLKSNDSQSEITITKKSCIDKDANEINCDVTISLQ